MLSHKRFYLKTDVQDETKRFTLSRTTLSILSIFGIVARSRNTDKESQEEIINYTTYSAGPRGFVILTGVDRSILLRPFNAEYVLLLSESVSDTQSVAVSHGFDQGQS